MGKSLLVGSVLAAVLILVIGFVLVLEQQDTEAAVIGLPEVSGDIDCPGTELYIGWGELENFALPGAEHEIGVLAVSSSQDAPPQVTLRIDGEIKDSLTVGRNVRLGSGVSLVFLGIHEESGDVRLCAIPSE